VTKTSNRVTYSIHTEGKPNLPSLVSHVFDCFAIFEGTGYWKGIPEEAARIDIIGTEQDRPAVETLARTIRYENAQEAVYVTSAHVQLTEVWTPSELREAV
jgi:hypothetical protein